MDFDQPDSRALFWYHSEEKEEPRLGFRYEEPGADRGAPPRDRPPGGGVAPGRSSGRDPALPIGRFLLTHPGLRRIVRRIQSLENSPYAEIRDNLLDRDCEPVDMLRGKLAMLGASRFDPKSLLWTRVTFFQGAPLADELACPDADDWAFATTGAGHQAA